MRTRLLSRAVLFGMGLCALVLPGVLVFGGCHDARSAMVRTTDAGQISPDTPVVSLGNLRWGKPPGRAEIELARFLFGAEPTRGPDLIKPLDILADAQTALVSDAGHAALFSVSTQADCLGGVALNPAPTAPGALSRADNGDLLVADLAGACVLRYDPAGRLLRRYALAGSNRFQPAGLVAVGHEIWVTNIAEHRIEVFDAASGDWQRSIGRRGRGPGEFGFPLGMARTTDGHVLVVDMFGARLQVFDDAGQWLRDIGGPGDLPGYFARPKDVAIGPDGTIFVTDAATQRVQAFDRDGRPLTAFGGDARDAARLALPAGIAITTSPPNTATRPPGDFTPDYYVLVAEQMAEPGVRVYAWRSRAPRPPAARPTASSAFQAKVPNPHWRADGCARCHTQSPSDGSIAAIPPHEVDTLCVSCHDGVQASAEAHPVGWPVEGDRTRAPQGWPLVDGRLGCLTCHDIARHCAHDAQRPAVNPAVVRDYDAARPIDFCTRCHVAEQWRVNPHRATALVGQRADALCGVCHMDTPTPPPVGSDVPNAALRQPGTQLCLNCHVMHADPAPGGHLNLAPQRPVELPLDAGRVSCSSCHNPHPDQPPDGTPYTQRAALAEDRRVALRMNYVDLCRECHAK